MSIDRLRSHWGFTRMPFGKDLAPSMLAATGAHAEAVARISWCVTEDALGVVTGEVGAGKTVAARAALAALDASRHTIIYLGNPAVGARGLYATIIAALGGTPRGESRETKRHSCCPTGHRSGVGAGGVPAGHRSGGAGGEPQGHRSVIGVGG